jgi:hypothetical protein
MCHGQKLIFALDMKDRQLCSFQGEAACCHLANRITIHTILITMVAWSRRPFTPELIKYMCR